MGLLKKAADKSVAVDPGEGSLYRRIMEHQANSVLESVPGLGSSPGTGPMPGSGTGKDRPDHKTEKKKESAKDVQDALFTLKKRLTSRPDSYLLPFELFDGIVTATHASNAGFLLQDASSSLVPFGTHRLSVETVERLIVPAILIDELAPDGVAVFKTTAEHPDLRPFFSTSDFTSMEDLTIIKLCDSEIIYGAILLGDGRTAAPEMQAALVAVSHAFGSRIASIRRRFTYRQPPWQIDRHAIAKRIVERAQYLETPHVLVAELECSSFAASVIDRHPRIRIDRVIADALMSFCKAFDAAGDVFRSGPRRGFGAFFSRSVPDADLMKVHYSKLATRMFGPGVAEPSIGRFMIAHASSDGATDEITRFVHADDPPGDDATFSSSS